VLPQDSKPTHLATYNEAPGMRQFWMRRFHSAMGIIFGGYIVVHLTINATGLSPKMYQQNVDKIHGMEPMLPVIELALIFGPLLFHIVWGIYRATARLKYNTMQYNYGGNVRYALQRWTAMILLVFVVFHVGTLHKWGLAGVHDVLEKIHPTPAGAMDAQLDSLQHFSAWCATWGGLFQPHNQAFQTTVTSIRNFWDTDNAGNPGNVAVMALYLLGVWSAVFHFANGLWTSAIAWGVTTTAAAQRRWGHVCLAFGILFLIVGTVAWYAFTMAPNAQRNMADLAKETHTLPDDSTVHEQDQSSIQKQQDVQQKNTTPGIK
jgi:succinate dehydrogenase / fumarate reductase cytochrome b subunit